jgi:hypothetical protein
MKDESQIKWKTQIIDEESENNRRLEVMND